MSTLLLNECRVLLCNFYTQRANEMKRSVPLKRRSEIEDTKIL
jgi:hypothetical protein